MSRSNKLVTRIVGLVVAIAAGYLVWRLMFAKIYAASAEAGYGTRMWLIIGFAAVVLGSTASSVTRWWLHRRAEQARIPAARVVGGTDHPKP